MARIRFFVVLYTNRRKCPAFFFFFNDTATTEIYTLSLHDALPIWDRSAQPDRPGRGVRQDLRPPRSSRPPRVRLRRGRHDHPCPARRQPEAADRPLPRAPIDGERDGAAEPRRGGGGRTPRSPAEDGASIREHRG